MSQDILPRWVGKQIVVRTIETENSEHRGELIDTQADYIVVQKTAGPIMLYKHAIVSVREEIKSSVPLT